jgi:hypothetical protein
MPPSLVQYLQNLSGRSISVDAVLSFDDEPRIQKELLRVFPAERVSFISVPSRQSDVSSFPLAASLKQPGKHFLVEIDCETYDLQRLAGEIPWLFEAEIILIRSTLGYFWSGSGDLRRIVQFLGERGFDFFDTPEYFKLLSPNTPVSRVVLVFENQKLKQPLSESSQKRDSESDGQRIGRINRALTFLSNPIARSSELVRLTGRGSLGFAAGVLNPGAITDGDKIILLARGEHIPWAISRRNMSDFLNGCRPVLFELDKQLAVTRINQAEFSKADESRGARLEDFRLFRHGEQLFSNHSRFELVDEKPSERTKPVRFDESARITVAISRVDLAANEINFLGNPTVDCPTGPAEKNWAMFEHQNQLHLIYSFNPFHLLRARQWPRLDFETVTRQKLVLPHGDDRIPFRNSVNPVEYDESFFLHVVHKVYPDKQYSFWAILIEKSSLLPKKISACPLVCGWKSAPASIIYACSIVVRQDEILIFGGLNDSSMGFWKIAREKLDQSWIALGQN